MQHTDEPLTGAFYRHFFNETLYVLPDNQATENTKQAVKETETVVAETAAPAFAFSGDNRKKLAIAVKLPANETVALAQNEFLVNILKAIQFSIPDVLFVNVLQNDVTFEALNQQADFRFLIVFGENVLKMPVSGKYQPTKIAEKPIVLADELNQIEKNTDLKRQLWAALKQVFLN